MRYRWGFEEGGVFTECFPILEDETAIDFAPQTNEMFYRAKLNGIISFRFEFDAILAKGYNYTHILVLQCYNDSDDSWKECWRGRFCLTDCEIDYDTNTINVQPETLDRYTAILDALENEYNLVKLAPDKQYVDILIRPCLQIYSLNNNKITNYVGNSWWESTCEPVSFSDISQLWKFHIVGTYYSVQVKWKSGAYAGQTINYTGTTRDGNQILVGRIYDGDIVIDTDTISVGRSDQQGDDISLLQIFRNGAYQCSVTFEYHGAGLEPISTWVSPTGDAEEVNAQWYDIYNRILVNTDLDYIDIGNQRVVFNDLGVDDMAGINLNYNKCASLNYSTIQVDMFDATQEEPTQWGMSYYEDRYFKKLPDVPPIHYAPVGIDLWKYASLWWYAYTSSPEDVTYKQICELMAKKQRIADCYTLSSTIVKLMQAAGWTGTNLVSKFLDGTNDYVGDSFIPVIAPRSNVISSYYATPAQNAPISLAMCFNMLKNVYKVYWYIDDDNDLHVEHISFFRNGLAYYDDQTGLLVNLEERLHTDTKSNKVFCQNKIKFDKQDMPETFTFGWADVQTKPFDGWPIKCLDAYVQKGQTDEHSEGKFDTDVDYVLTSPQDVTKDGFFLFAVPATGGVTDWSLNVQPVRIIDEEGESYDIEIQNADAAFVKIHESFWRYDMPCEQLNVNNANTVALSTGNFKSQTIEYADTIMADLLKDIANCIKVIRTQQGDGHIKSMSVNLNSLHTKTDLLFNFIGRWYYLRGTALSASIDIIVNNTLINLDVTNNSFLYRYQEPITQLDFHQADVVSVDFSDCDKLDGLTSCDYMFDGCEELIGVNFGKKTFGAVTSAQYMFRGCSALTTLICPSTSSWQPDIDFSDCPALTEDSLYQFIRYLYVYDSGVHTITTNSTMWNALAGAVQNDIIAKANAKGWMIAISTAYIVSGTSTSNSEIFNISFIDDNQQITQETIICPVNGGTFKLKYKNKKIYSLDNFVNSNSLTSIDFSESDGLTELTSATDAFSGCTSLSAISIGTFTWLVDIVLSDCPITSASMLAFLGNFEDYSLDSQHLVRISPYSAADMGADADAIKTALSAKNWRLPLSALGKYTRAQLKTLVDNGYVPIATQADFAKIENDTPSLFAEDSEFYGTYTSATNGNSIVVHPITMTGTPSKTIGGVFDGNLLNIKSLEDYGDGGSAFFSTNNGTIRNVFYNGRAYAHNSNCSFCITNNGIVEDCVIDIQISAAVYSNAVMRTNDGIVRRCAIRGYHTNWPSADYWGVRWLWLANNGTIEDCVFLGTFKRSNNTSVTGVFGAYTNSADAIINRCVCNAIANNPSTAFGLTNNGTITDCLQNNDRKFNRGAALAKTDAELKADAIGNGIYANYSTDIWDKDNDGYPIIKLIKDFDWGGDYTAIGSYDALYALATILETQIAAETITLSTAFWNGLTAEQQATIEGVLQSKNYNLATA